MKLNHVFVRATAALIAITASTLAAAADKDDFEQQAERIRSGPKSAPVQNETGFSQGLKCMDGLFRTFGIRNVTVVIDQIPDSTKKINVGARDMFMSATSQMTRTTHAIRLIPGDLRIISESRRDKAVNDADFLLQGSITQFDDSMLTKQRDGAICIWYLCIGAADSDAFSGLGLDLNLVENAGLSLVPGANVRNAVLIRKKGKGFDGDLIYKKYSVQFNFTLVSNDGNGQALRTLVDLGAIELYGRLLRLPYWTCLGANDQDPEVKSEINDWWEEMAADPHDRTRLFAYLQLQMKAQGVYDGEINGHVDPALLRAVRAYRVALGQPDDVNLDASFLRKYLAADHVQARKLAAAKLAEIAQQEGPLPPPPTAQSAPPAAATPTAANTTAPPSVAPVASAAGAAPAATQTPTPAAQSVATSTAAAVQTSAPSSVAAVQPAVSRAASPAPAVAQASTPAAQPVATSTTGAAQTSTPSPVAAAQPAVVRAVAAASTTQPATVKTVAYHPPVATIPIEGSRPANNAAYRAGEPFYVGVISPRDGYLYCYLVDDQQRVSQFYPAPAQSSTQLSRGTLTVVNSESPLLAGRPERKEKVACFSSPKDLGRQPLEAASIVGLESLKMRFAVAVSGTYAMGVFDVKVQ